MDRTNETAMVETTNCHLFLPDQDGGDDDMDLESFGKKKKKKKRGANLDQAEEEAEKDAGGKTRKHFLNWALPWIM